MKTIALAALMVAIVGPAGAQSMEGWQRIPDAQLKFEQDHAACTPKPVPKELLRGAATPPGLTNMATPLPPGPSFAQCMRQKGWIKP